MTSLPTQPLGNTKLFQPIRVGKNVLSTRIAFAPSTRFRALDDHTVSDLQLEYYDDRSKFPGTLIVVEGTIPSVHAGFYARVPGIFHDDQIEGWRKINNKIHKNGSFSTMQLWGLGRTADPAENKKHGVKLKAPSAIYQIQDHEMAAKKAGNELEAFTTQEVEELIDDYVRAAKRAIEAGFDYVEVQCTHSYLLNQFIESSSNERTDKFGGSLEKRARIILDIVDKASEEIGADRLAIRISPWMRYTERVENMEVHPVATYGYILGELQKRAASGKELAYVSVIEPRIVPSSETVVADVPALENGDNTFVRTVWKGILLRAGNYTYDAPEFKQVVEDVSDDRTLVGFSRYFIANPDLVTRLHDGKPLNQYDRSTFYTFDNWGYNTYPSLGHSKLFDKESEKARKPAKISNR